MILFNKRILLNAGLTKMYPILSILMYMLCLGDLLSILYT